MRDEPGNPLNGVNASVLFNEIEGALIDAATRKGITDIKERLDYYKSSAPGSSTTRATTSSGLHNLLFGVCCDDR